MVHFGVGNFHRAHQAVYLDDLFNTGADHDWAIVGAGVRETDIAMREKLAAQDYLTTVVEQEANAMSAHVTAAMTDFLAPFDVAATVTVLADPQIRIVSLTVTEGGYYISPATQRFDPEHPDIVYDATHVDEPKTAFGLILAGLKKRRRAWRCAFHGHVMRQHPRQWPCDGERCRRARGALRSAFRAVDSRQCRLPEFDGRPHNARYQRSRARHPQRPVGRRGQLASILRGVPPVGGRGPFPSGRPAFEKVGVTFTSDVAPYELMKIRILNGGHAAIAYPAGLLDIHFVHEAMEDRQIAEFLETLTKREIIPVVPPPPEVDLEAYRKKVAERFANPKIADTIARLCLDGSNRQPKFVLPTVRDRLSAGAGVAGLALVSAMWCRYCYGESESGKTIPPNDPSWDRLQAAAKPARNDPKAWLAMSDIFGDLATNPTYVEAFSSGLSSLWSKGVRATLAAYLGAKA